eukprot:6212350-Pleurochrysis_carterae.AAC.1
MSSHLTLSTDAASVDSPPFDTPRRRPSRQKQGRETPLAPLRRCAVPRAPFRHRDVTQPHRAHLQTGEAQADQVRAASSARRPAGASCTWASAHPRARACACACMRAAERGRTRRLGSEKTRLMHEYTFLASCMRILTQL